MGAASHPGTVVNWNDLPLDDVRPGVRRRGFGTDNVLLVMNELEPGMDLAPHTHDFDQIAYIVSGRAIFHLGGVGHEVGPGSIMLVPAGQEHYIDPIGDEPVRNLDVFAPARSDLLHLLDWMSDRD